MEIMHEYLIGNLDESGYLRRELFNLVDDLAFSQNIMTTEEEIEQVLREVQELEPAGVGARDLKECLLIHNDDSRWEKCCLNRTSLLFTFNAPFERRCFLHC